MTQCFKMFFPAMSSDCAHKCGKKGYFTAEKSTFKQTAIKW